MRERRLSDDQLRVEPDRPVPARLDRRRALTAFGFVGAAVASVASPAVADAAAASSSVFLADSVDDLRALASASADSLYCVKKPGQAGLFYYDAADTTSADDTGTVVVSGSGLRFKRVVPDEAVVDVRWFGAVGDGATDDLAAINRAVAHLAGLSQPDATLAFPASAGYAVAGTVDVPAGISIDMESPLVYTGAANEPCLRIGPPAGSNAVVFNRRFRLRARRAALSDWTDENSIGIQLVNCNDCEIDVFEAERFTIGVQFLGAGEGFSYNLVQLGYLIDNKIGADLTNQKVNGATGWCNENVFLNGRFSVSSTTQLGQSRYGVRSTSLDGTYPSNNNNVFYKPSFELNAAKASPGEALPILIEYGRLNRFESIRYEGDGPYVMRVMNDSIWNEVFTGYGFAPVDDQSLRPSTVAHSRINSISDVTALVFDSGPMHKTACYYDGATAVQVPRLGFGQAADGASHLAGPMTLTDQYLESSSDGDAAIGVYLSTAQNKRFVIKRDCDAGYRGHLVFVCYDGDGNVLGDPDGTWQNANVKTVIDFTTFTWHADRFGGSYETAGETIPDFYFVVGEAVQSVRVLLWRGDTPLRVRSFQIHALDTSTAAVWSGVDDYGDGSNFAVKPPSTGTWPRGKVVLNAQPGAPADPADRVGGAEITVGWQKVTSGSANELHRDWVPITR